MTPGSPSWSCDSSAPIARSDASVSRINSPSLLANANTGGLVSASRRASKAFCCSSLHTNYFFHSPVQWDRQLWDVFHKVAMVISQSHEPFNIFGTFGDWPVWYCLYVCFRHGQWFAIYYSSKILIFRLEELARLGFYLQAMESERFTLKCNLKMPRQSSSSALAELDSLPWHRAHYKDQNPSLHAHTDRISFEMQTSSGHMGQCALANMQNWHPTYWTKYCLTLSLCNQW